MGNKITRGKTVKHGATDEEIREFMTHVRPLDLLVFRGSEIFSKTIRVLETAVTGSGEISHVEMCITRELCPSIGPLKAKSKGTLDGDRTLLSWGSTASGPLNDGVPNAETGKSKFGVQIRILYDLVKNYLQSPDANVGVCRLHENPAMQLPREPLEDFLLRRQRLTSRLTKAYADYNGTAYDANALSLLSALFPQLRGIHNATTPVTAKFFNMNKWLFCSEFVARVYIDIGVITDATDGKVDGQILKAEHVLPVDFIGFDTDPNGIRVSICDKPIWIKPMAGYKRSALERMGTVVHNTVPFASLVLTYPSAATFAEAAKPSARRLTDSSASSSHSSSSSASTSSSASSVLAESSSPAFTDSAPSPPSSPADVPADVQADAQADAQADLPADVQAADQAAEAPEAVAALAAAAEALPRDCSDSQCDGTNDDASSDGGSFRPATARPIVSDSAAMIIQDSKPKKIGKLRKLIARGK